MPLSKLTVYTIIMLSISSSNSCFCNIHNEPRSLDTFEVSEHVVLNNIILHDNTSSAGIFLNGSNIILTNNSNNGNNYFLHLYSLENKQLTGKYVKFGRAYGQVLGPLSYGLYNKRTFFVEDVMLKKLLTIDLDKGLFDDSISYKEYPMPDFRFSVQLMANDKLISTGNKKKPEIIQVDNYKTNKQEDSFGTLPAAPANVPFESWKAANESFLFLKPDETKVVTAARYSDRVEIFNLATKESKLLNERIKPEFMPILIGKEYGIQRTEKTVFTFTTGAVTNKYIYLLFSGKKEEEEYPTYSKEIYVYDWSGKSIKKLVLNKYISGFAVTEDDSEIYAFDVENKYIVHALLNN